MRGNTAKRCSPRAGVQFSVKIELDSKAKSNNTGVIVGYGFRSRSI